MKVRKKGLIPSYAKWGMCFTSVALCACAQVVRPDGKLQFVDKVTSPVLSTSAKTPAGQIADYENQLLPSGGSYATLRGFPFMDFVNGFRPLHPIVIYSVNGLPLKRPPMPIFGDLRTYHLSRALVKLPPGNYQSIIVTGVTSGGNQWFTEIQNAVLEQNTHYVLRPDSGPSGEQISIYAYTADKRFSPEEKEYYALTKQVGTTAILGNYKKIHNW